MKKFNLKADYKYYSIPKVDKDAFLIARITGWEDLDIIDGEANIFIRNIYTGTAFINTRFIEDTLDLSLGRDNKVLVTRTKKKDYSSKKVIGQNKKELFTYEIIAKNNRKVPIKLDLKDQIPVSQENDIIVDVIDISGAKLDDLSGKLEWEVKLQPGESKKYIVSFSVKYPKNRTVKIRRSRAVKGASFF